MPTSTPKTESSTPSTVSDFAILPLTLPNVKLPAQIGTPEHYLYIKPHEPSQPTLSADRSLFIANVPVDAQENNIRELFITQLGGARVESVEFDTAVPAIPSVKRWKTNNAAGGESKSKKRKRDEDVVAEGVIEDEKSALPKIWNTELRKSGGCAVVAFVDRPSMKGAWKEVQRAIKEGKEVTWMQGDGLGIERYKSHNTLRYPPKALLQASVNAYLTQFTRTEVARNRVRAKQRSVPDEDGFITVTRGGRAGPARLEQAEAKQKELQERKEKNGTKGDFYRFQGREKRKEAEGELRRKFEADRKRVEEMRARRGRVRPET
ncbi:ribosomal RNA-processing protein 7-domain-containing protein [Dendryphion nanum]|uniref:Ribosomal RNA-processing protein 7-domain-containing protein n=1 Tax=Dendryphion nanum TaxID=256645 RepID=A0A9P9EJC8_9PLEO|nr:ribosomal RNA-processing protein 7-domain-containing protein [Dendryphion nanum]